MKQLLALYLIKLKTALYEGGELCKVVFCFWRKKSFRRVDMALIKSYLWRNPYRISKRYWEEREKKEVDLYGETPLTTLYELLIWANLHQNDHFFDLGSGRGRAVFFVSQYCGVDATGVETIADFVKRANAIQKRFALDRCHFIEGNFNEINLKKASLVYFYGLFLDKGEEGELIGALAKMKKGARLITISFSISDIDHEGLFTQVGQKEVSFNWGRTEAFLQVRA